MTSFSLPIAAVEPNPFAPIAALLAQEPPVPAALRAPVPTPAAAFEDMRLSADEAGAILPAGRYVHVIVSAATGDARERWTRECVHGALRAARAIRLTLPATRAIGFGLAVDRRQGGTLIIETDTVRLRAQLAAQADRLAKE